MPSAQRPDKQAVCGIFYPSVFRTEAISELLTGKFPLPSGE